MSLPVTITAEDASLLKATELAIHDAALRLRAVVEEEAEQFAKLNARVSHGFGADLSTGLRLTCEPFAVGRTATIKINQHIISQSSGAAELALNFFDDPQGALRLVRAIEDAAGAVRKYYAQLRAEVIAKRTSREYTDALAELQARAAAATLKKEG